MKETGKVHKVLQGSSMLIKLDIRLLFILLFLAIFVLYQLYVFTSGFTLLPNAYQYLYERSINSVIRNGNLAELRHIFDNFASSPGSIITCSFLSLTLDMEPSTLLVVLSLFSRLFFLTLFAILVLKSVYEELKWSSFLVAFLSSGCFTVLLQPIYTYGTDGYLMFLLILIIVFRIIKTKSLKINHVVTLIISLISMNIIYSPLALYTLFILVSLFVLMEITGIKIEFVKSIIVVSFCITMTYYAFMGFWFYSDFMRFLQSIFTALRFESFSLEYVQRRTAYDQIYGFLYSISLLKYTSVFLVLIYVGRIILCKSSRSMSKLVFVVNFYGVILYLIGFIPYVGIGALTDFGSRILSVSYVFYLSSIYSVVTDIFSPQICLHSNFRFLNSLFKYAIILFTLTSFIGSTLSPIAYSYLNIRGFELHTQYKYGYEGLHVSSFIHEKIDENSIREIMATRRYVYLYSRYGISFNFLETNHDVYEVIKARNALSILPVLITLRPDTHFGPLPNEVFQILITNKNIVLNSGLSVALL
jgi:hypothetical protein